jgi:uncharacterized membrane protein
MTVHAAGRWLHLGCGFAAVALGLAVMLLSKRRWHRWLGRVYVVLIAGASGLGLALAARTHNLYLMVLGAVTLTLVLLGVREVWLARRSGAGAARHVRRHLILMGASYVGAWSGFFATNPILGVSEPVLLGYVFGPSAIGAVLIGRAASRV